MMPAGPGAAFEVVQPEFLLHLLVVQFHAPASPRDLDQALATEFFRQVAQIILGRLGFFFWPLDQ
jgi:hypothetical protein